MKRSLVAGTLASAAVLVALVAMTDCNQKEEASGEQTVGQGSHVRVLHKRWLRDFTADGHRYVPEENAKPSRMHEGFELREDGTYIELTAGADDSEVESSGTWKLDDDGALLLEPATPDRSVAANLPAARRIRIVKVDDDELIVEEEQADPEN